MELVDTSVLHHLLHQDCIQFSLLSINESLTYKTTTDPVKTPSEVDSYTYTTGDDLSQK